MVDDLLEEVTQGQEEETDDEETDDEEEAPGSVDLARYESFAKELVRFYTPDDLPSEHAELVSKIVVLDHRSLHAFGAHSPERAEVKALLRNAVISAGYSLDGYVSTKVQPIDGAAALYKQAEEIFTRHMESRNRVRYVCGVAGGIVVLTIGAYLSSHLPNAISQEIDYLPAYIWWAGLGSIVSVLMRLSKLDVGREISTFVLVTSGFGRPLVASALALVAYLTIHNKLISISVAGGDPKPGVYFVVAFLCGFSERFAQDIAERAEKTFAPRSKQA